jgi:phosphonate degradation associated HDIG domain protein
LRRPYVSAEDVIDRIFETFQQRGDQMYGEQVTQTEHALQAAFAAEQDGASETLIAAALLHDYGHLIHDLPGDAAGQGIDALHEKVGAGFLEPFFVPAVTEPARLHVAAKRYLCAVDPAYFHALSPASVRSLGLQGGPFNHAEVKAFESSPYFVDAVRLRRYDEMGKVPGAQTPDLEHYRPCLRAGLKR